MDNSELSLAAAKFEILDYVPLGICIINKDYITVFWNSFIENMCGIGKEKIIGYKITESFAHLNEPKYRSRIDPMFIGGPPAIFSSELHTSIFPSNPDDNRTTIQQTIVTSIPAYKDRQSYVMFTVTDISELTKRVHKYRAMRDKALQEIEQRKKVETALKLSLEEKNVMLNEIHHRVKNNMQIISSLINLQKNHLKEEEGINAFCDLQGRIITMSTVHNMLYKSDNYSSVILGNYIREISDTLLQTFQKDRQIISINYNIDDNIKISITKAVPCGLILNELITNSLKYAFNDNQKGIIDITLRLNDEKIHLLYKDSGPGMSGDFQLSETKTMGMNLIKTLLGQLKGSIVISSVNGFSVNIEFPE